RTLLIFLVLLVSFTAYAPPVSNARRAVVAVQSRRVEAVQFQSKLIGQALPYNVVLPPDYAQASARATRYPVLYLLHGLGGSAGDWVSQKAHLADYAARHRLLVVVPEGRDAWYTDSATVAAEKFETYFLQELIPDVQARFRTIEAREGRAVAGLSMGGYGALKFGLKHPEMFVFAASMSGALGAASWLPDEHLPAFVKPSIVRAFGTTDNPTRQANDIFKLARELPAEKVPALPFLYLDCGTEDFLIQSNRAFATLLLERKIPHEFRQLPGGHSWPYWDAQVQEILRIASQRMTPPRGRG
ncbi:MAG TPA: alpha/beta hydrolase family protein, partial [Pyrinomonadaceae bacterium]|nr:alpha/beta hydrolase family protein [Pyrinomonadaceae bacterium]